MNAVCYCSSTNQKLKAQTGGVTSSIKAVFLLLRVLPWLLFGYSLNFLHCLPRPCYLSFVILHGFISMKIFIFLSLSLPNIHRCFFSRSSFSSSDQDSCPHIPISQHCIGFSLPHPRRNITSSLCSCAPSAKVY